MVHFARSFPVQFRRQEQEARSAFALSRNIVVPQDLSVIGVDNSRFICLHTNSPLSSIQPDSESAGYKAAAAIDAINRELQG